jgi:hypothetical protein
MVINWFKLIAALALILTPMGIFHGTKVRLRAVARDWTGYWGQTFTLGLHWIDLGRAALGGLILLEAIILQPGASSVYRYGVPLLHATVAGLGVLLQTFVCKERDHAHAPLAFVTGLAFGLFSPVVAGFSILLALIASSGIRAPLVYFPILGLALPGLAFLFDGRKTLLPSAAIGAVVVLPWLLTLMFPRDLVISYRARRVSAENSADLQPRR